MTIFLASNLDRVQQHLRLELTKKQKEKEDYERLIQELAVSELEEKESQNEKVLIIPYYHSRKLGLLIRDLSWAAKDPFIPNSSVGCRSAITVGILGFGRQGHSNSI